MDKDVFYNYYVEAKAIEAVKKELAVHERALLEWKDNFQGSIHADATKEYFSNHINAIRMKERISEIEQVANQIKADILAFLREQSQVSGVVFRAGTLDLMIRIHPDDSNDVLIVPV